MLKLTDLSVNKELDREAQAEVRGGVYELARLPFDLSTTFDFMSSHQPSAAVATTGPQAIGQVISDNDVAVAGHGGIALNFSNNNQHAQNLAAPTAISLPIAVKA